MKQMRYVHSILKFCLIVLGFGHMPLSASYPSRRSATRPLGVRVFKINGVIGLSIAEALETSVLFLRCVF